MELEAEVDRLREIIWFKLIEITGLEGKLEAQRETLQRQILEERGAAAYYKAKLERLRVVVKRLPVEEWVEQDAHGDPELIGYVMQAQGEWDDVMKALRD